MSKISDLSMKQKIVFILFLLIQMSALPYVVALMFGINNDILWVPLAMLCCLFSISIFQIRLPKAFTACCLVQILVWFYFFIYHSDTSYLTRIVFILVTSLLLNCIDCTIGLKKLSLLQTKWIALQAMLAVVGFILVFVGILGPLIEFPNIDGRPIFYFGCTFSNAVYGNIIRPSGFFDEPGALAFWGIYVLVINKIFIGNKRLEFILIASLVFTLSLAYYIQLIIYLVLFYGKNIKTSLPIVVFILAVFAYISLNSGSEIYELTLGRLELFAQEGLNSTSRGELTEVSKGYFEHNPWFGIGAKKIEELGVYAADNPYETLGKDGIIGTIALYLPLLPIFIKSIKKNWYMICGILVLAAGYLQRPFHLNCMHFIMLYLFSILAMKNQDKLNK